MSEDHSFVSVRGNFPDLRECGFSRRLSQASTSVRSWLQPVVEHYSILQALKNLMRTAKKSTYFKEFEMRILSSILALPQGISKLWQ